MKVDFCPFWQLWRAMAKYFRLIFCSKLYRSTCISLSCWKKNKTLFQSVHFVLFCFVLFCFVFVLFLFCFVLLCLLFCFCFCFLSFFLFFFFFFSFLFFSFFFFFFELFYEKGQYLLLGLQRHPKVVRISFFLNL